MKKKSAKNLSLLGIILMVASAVTAAVVPGNANGERVNNGTLRLFSATVGEADQDAAQAVVSCIPDLDVVLSCTATNGSATTIGFFAVDSYILVNGLYHQTAGSTSQTGGIAGDQNSVLVTV